MVEFKDAETRRKQIYIHVQEARPYHFGREMWRACVPSAERSRLKFQHIGLGQRVIHPLIQANSGDMHKGERSDAPGGFRTWFSPFIRPELRPHQHQRESQILNAFREGLGRDDGGGKLSRNNCKSGNAPAGRPPTKPKTRHFQSDSILLFRAHLPLYLTKSRHGSQRKSTLSQMG